MFDFMNKGNPNLNFSAGASPSNVAPFTKPTQGQIGDPSKAMALMSMLSGMQKGGSPTETFGPEYSGADNAPLFQTQRDPSQTAYQQAIMKALIGGRS